MVAPDASVETVVQRINPFMRQSAGSLKASKKIGQGVLTFVQQVTNQEISMYEPRIKYNFGMDYSFSQIGVDYLVVTHDTMLNNTNYLPFISAAAQ